MKLRWQSYVMMVAFAIVSIGPGRVLAENEAFLHPAMSSSPPVVSSSQRFVFRGFRSEDGLKLSSWVEKVAGKLESVVGSPLPFQRREMIRFTARRDETSASGRVQLGQKLMDGLLQQRVGLENPERLDEESVLEGFMAVLLYRYVIAEYQATGSFGQPVVPDWFTVGMAQSLQPGLRDRNKRFVVDQWEAGEGHRVAEITEWISLPAGRVTQKADCGLLVDWLQKPIREQVGWQAAWQRLAAGQVLDVEWVRNDLLQLMDARDVEKAWDLHLAAQTQVNHDWGALTFEQVADLKRILTRYVSKYSGSGYAPTSELHLGDLVLMREEAWVTKVASGILVDLGKFAVGRAPSIREVAENYQRFFQALESPKRMDPTFRFTVGGHDAVLNKLLRAANDSMEQLEKEVAMRSLYINQATAKPAVGRISSPTEKAGSKGAGESGEGDTLEKRRKSYLDAIEMERGW